MSQPSEANVIEQRQQPSCGRWAAHVAAVAALVLLTVCVWLVPRMTGDTFMILAGGQDIVDGKLGEPDDWAFTTRDAVWINQSWGASLVFHLAYTGLGEVGLLAVKFVLVAALGLFVALVGRCRGADWPATLLVAALTLRSCRHFIDMRPNLFWLTLLPAMLWVLYVACGHVHRIWLSVAVVVLWANMHGSFPFAIGMLGLWSICQLIAGWRGGGTSAVKRQWPLMVAPPVAIVLCGVASPWGLTNLTFPFSSLLGESNRVWRSVQEWRPIFGPNAGSFGSSVEMFIGLGLIAAGAAARCVLSRRGGAATKRSGSAESRDRQHTAATVFHVMLLLVSLYMALSSRRFIPTVTIVAAPLLAEMLHWALRRKIVAWSLVAAATVFAAVSVTMPAGGAPSLFQYRLGQLSWTPLLLLAALVGSPVVIGAWRWRRDHAPHWPAAALALVVIIANLALANDLSRRYAEDHPLYPSHTVFRRMVYWSAFPDLASQFVNVNDIRGRVFHDWRWEGFLRWRCGERLKLYLGGRAQTVYRPEQYEAYLQIGPLDRGSVNNPQRLRAVLDRLVDEGVQLAILFERPSRMINEMVFNDQTEWAPLYFDTRVWIIAHDSPEMRPLIVAAARGELSYPSEGIAALSRALCLSSARVRAVGPSYVDAVDKAGRLLPDDRLYAAYGRAALRLKLSDEQIREFLRGQMRQLAGQELTVPYGLSNIQARKFICNVMMRFHARGDAAASILWQQHLGELNLAIQQWRTTLQLPDIPPSPAGDAGR